MLYLLDGCIRLASTPKYLMINNLNLNHLGPLNIQVQYILLLVVKPVCLYLGKDFLSQVIKRG